MLRSSASRAIAATVFAVLLAAVAHLVLSVQGAGPAVSPGGNVEALPLGAGTVVEQTLFVPGCDLGRISLQLAAPAPGATVRLELFDVVRDNAWPADAFATVVVSSPASADTIDFHLPQRRAWHATWGMRLTSAEGAAAPPSLLIRRGSTYRAGLLRVNGGIRDADDLVFRAHVADGGVLGFLPCAVSGAPAPLGVPVVWLGLLVVACAAIAVLIASGFDSRPEHRRFAFIATAFAALALAWLAVIPPFEGPDERQHFAYARYVAREGLPHEAPPARDPDQDQWVQEPLYYLLASRIVRRAGTDAPVIKANPRAAGAGGREGLLHVHRGLLQPAPARRAFYALRALGVTFGIVILWGVWRLVRNLTRSAWTAAALTLAVVLVPSFTSQIILVSNDSLATLFTTCAIVVLLANQQALTSGRACLGGLLAGLALTTKLTTAFVIPIGALAVVLSPLARTVPPLAPEPMTGRLGWRLLAWFGVGVAVAASWLLVWNALTFGDPLAAHFKQTIMSRLGIEMNQPVTLKYLTVDLTSHLFRAFWAVGWTWEHYVPRAGSRVWWLYGFTSAACVVATLVAAFSTARWWRGPRPASPAHPHDIAGSGWLVTLSLAAVAVDLAGFYHENTRYAHITFRHLLPLQGPLLVLVVVGLRQIVGVVGKRSGTDVSRPLAAIWLVALALAMFVALRQYIVVFQFAS